MANPKGAPQNLRPAWKPGESGNPSGRPKNQEKLKADFIDALQKHFETHGLNAIERVFRQKPDKYMDVIARVLPRDIDITTHKSPLPEGERDELMNWLIGQLAAPKPATEPAKTIALPPPTNGAKH